MADYPVRQFSKREIKEAGKKLCEEFLYSPETVDGVAHVFRVAHNWRMAHALPMVRVRGKLATISGAHADTAGRVKRIGSIRKKLRRAPYSLADMQDLAGVRAILDSMEEVRRVEAWFREGKRADRLSRCDDYIDVPKASGYRSVHLVQRYDGNSAPHQGMKVEIQIRTRLQHIWATAGEAIGAIRGEDLKASEGNCSWLRILQIMSGHFADMEGCPLPVGVPQTADERADELADLNRETRAAEVFSTIRAIDANIPRDASAFLISLDAKLGVVKVEPKETYFEGSEGYLRQSDEGEAIQSVLVSVRDMKSLRRAYPNYFLDIGEFVDHFRNAARLKPVHDRLDLSFLRGWRGRR